MFVERRKIRRHAVNRVAQYHSGLGTLPRACMVTDMSETGARLYCEAALPETFTLALSGERETRRECRVVWRLGGECGVEFTDGWRR